MLLGEMLEYETDYLPEKEKNNQSHTETDQTERVAHCVHDPKAGINNNLLLLHRIKQKDKGGLLL